ncbi:MAG: hypothetical protein FVQ79_14330 [Planctomycetes bacterium]|nr:hypothetical protein [Planctomycetota bacterium]
MFSRSFSLILCVLLLSSGLTGCSSISSVEKATFDDATVVWEYLKPDSKEENSLSFHAGPFRGGTAVLGSNGRAFWVKDGVGYAVNDKARKAAPSLEQAPEDITLDDAFISAVIG